MDYQKRTIIKYKKMCSFTVAKGRANNDAIRFRGPDITNKETHFGLNFTHNLLAVTGVPTPQPFVDKEIVVVYSGEVYNHPFSKSDGENIIPLYRKHGLLFANELDGEFAIALYDFKTNIALFVTDRFGTKPLWRSGIECASYRSGVGGREIEPNTVECVQISTEKELFRVNYHEWDWNQYKDSYDDFLNAFERSIKKRATERCFLGLSSGYDSGAICHELVKQGVNFKAFSILNNESIGVIIERGKKAYEFDTIAVSKDSDLLKDVEDIEYIRAGEKSVKEDKASYGLASICKQAKREGRKVYLSGQGADEIIGDYKLYPKQSAFKGVFPDELKEWENFSGGLQRDYIHKEEHVAGAYGIETRYPFLDTEVVQEFLWLKPELKNRNYKAPIYEYLIKNHVPFDKEVKRGFRPFA
jgi:asparagine synthetase B (glutamine-hydrolysing)